jgi:uncharacterized cupredoxin-like copper-binding protein
MRRNGSKQMGAALLCAALLAGLPFFIACGSNTTDQENQTVQVRVTDHQIEMPPSLPTGVTTFEVTNAGSGDHSLGITGPAGDAKLEAPLKPGETGSLEMVLDSGTYRVYCPVSQSHGHSMQVALNVRPSAAGSG